MTSLDMPSQEAEIPASGEGSLGAGDTGPLSGGAGLEPETRDAGLAAIGGGKASTARPVGDTPSQLPSVIATRPSDFQLQDPTTDGFELRCIRIRKTLRTRHRNSRLFALWVHAGLRDWKCLPGKIALAFPAAG